MDSNNIPSFKSYLEYHSGYIRVGGRDVEKFEDDSEYESDDGYCDLFEELATYYSNYLCDSNKYKRYSKFYRFDTDEQYDFNEGYIGIPLKDDVSRTTKVSELSERNASNKDREELQEAFDILPKILRDYIIDQHKLMDYYINFSQS